jgi:NAD(P)-dependent dehydrogenase (short-subunit alcohol dehydrogenase family)
MNKPVVLVTGALTGIGRATALAFAEEGARIVVSGRRDEEGKKLVAEIRSAQRQNSSAPMCDVRKRCER